MALTVDATSSGYNGNPAVSSLTVSHTNAAGDSVLVVGVAVQSTSDIISSVTYNGVAMSRAVEADVTAQVAIYTLDAPDSGTHDIVVTLSSGARVGLGAVSFTTGGYAIGNSGVNNGSSKTPSQACTTNGQTGFVIAVCFFNDPAGFTYTGSGTSIDTSTHAGQLARSFVYEAFSGGANPTETWNETTNTRDWDTAYVEIYDLSSVKQSILQVKQAVNRSYTY